MRKQLTGEPVAGKLHTGFGGRGRRSRSLPLFSGRYAKLCITANNGPTVTPNQRLQYEQKLPLNQEKRLDYGRQVWVAKLAL
jgi:hypothetical protein